MSDAQGGEGRRRIVALLVLLAVAVPLVVVALATSGGGSPGSGLRIERSTAPGSDAPEIIVYVVDQSSNVAETAGGRANVELECLDGDDRTVVRATHPWPFTDTDGGVIDPHVHQELTARQSQRIARCRLNGTDGPLEGRPSGEGG